MALHSPDQLQEVLAHLTDVSKNYDASESIEGRESRAAIRGAARQLILATSTPEDVVWDQVLHMTELVSLRTCLKLGVFQNIPANGSISAADLAKAVNASPSLVERLLRIPVGTGFLDQTRPDGGDYKHTKSSITYTDVGVPSPGTFFQAMYDVYLKTTLTLDGQIEKKFQGRYEEPSSNFDNPFVSYYGKDGQSAWDVMASIPDVMKTFQISLKAVDQIVPPVAPYYDFNQFKATTEEPDRIQLVDVGGGYGKVLQEIVSASTELDPSKCIVQDVEGVIGIADAARSMGLQTMVIDFHSEQPVKGAKAYYMRFISHDYSDKDVINILSHVAKSMAPDSKLLLAESVIPSRLTEGSLTAGILDQLMFCIGGKERTETGFKEILNAVGLELISVNKLRGTTGAIVEAKLKQ